jgi:hypothetical protein
MSTKTLKDSSTLCALEGISDLGLRPGQKVQITRRDNGNTGVFTVKGASPFQAFFQEKEYHTLMKDACKATPVVAEVAVVEEQAPVVEQAE